MIKLVLPDYPDKELAYAQWEEGWPISDEIIPSGLFDTEITHNGEQPSFPRGDRVCWDVDVYFILGQFRLRIPALSGQADTKEMLLTLMRADNGTADLWVRELLGDPDADGLWDAHARETAL